MSRGVVGLLLAVPAFVGVVWDEVLLAAPIVVLVEALGFWLAYVFFCIAWAAIGLAVLSVWLRAEPWIKRRLGKAESPPDPPGGNGKLPSEGWKGRTIAWFAGIARVLGALAVGVLLGPVFGWPAFKLLGYNERSVYGLTFLTSWIFGAVWVPFYGLGVWGFGLSRLI